MGVVVWVVVLSARSCCKPPCLTYTVKLALKAGIKNEFDHSNAGQELASQFTTAECYLQHVSVVQQQFAHVFFCSKYEIMLRYFSCQPKRFGCSPAHKGL